MNYVVVDLEWNQAMSSKSSVFNKLPIHLRGEIIEIGAVKLKEDMSPGEEFTIDVKPVYFRRMHYKVKKITGFDKERLAHGVSFSDALDQFRAWCGEDVTFITWGCDDQGILEQNIIIHDLDWDWILAARMPNRKEPRADNGPEPLLHESFEDLESKAAAFTDRQIAGLCCPVCGAELEGLKWINQGDQRYMNLFSCPEHGQYLARARFRKNKDSNTWTANKLVYQADEAMLDFYKAKSNQSRRRGRGHSRKKNRPAK